MGQQRECPYSMKNDPESIGVSNIRHDITSYSLVKVLLNEHRLTYVGTIKKNKRDLP